MVKRDRDISINNKKFTLQYDRGVFNITKNKDIDSGVYYDDSDNQLLRFMYSELHEIKFVDISKEANDYFMQSQIVKPKRGRIYLVSDGQFVKVGGTTNNLQKRINELQTGNPRKLKLLGSYQVSYLLQSERMVQDLYKDRNVLNEWFDLGVQDISYILSEKIKYKENIVPSCLPIKEMTIILEAQKDIIYDEYLYKLKLLKRQINKLSGFNYSKSSIERICGLKSEKTANEYLKKYDVEAHFTVIKAIEKYEKEVKWLIDYIDYINSKHIDFMDENGIYFDDDIGKYICSEVSA